MLGTRLIIIAGLIGAAISAYYYLVPGVGLDGEGGVLLVIVSSGLMVLAGLALLGVGGAVGRILSFLIILDVIGTSVAGYFLQTPLLIGAMVLALAGWLMRSVGNAANRSVEVT